MSFGIIGLLFPTFSHAAYKFNPYTGKLDYYETSSGGSGTVTNIATTAPITGGPITTTGTIAISDAAADGSTKGASSYTAADFNSSSGLISIDYANGQKATTGQPGFMTAAQTNYVKCINISPVSTITNWFVMKAPAGMTISNIDCIVDAATSVVLAPQECNGNGASCTALLSANVTCGTTNTAGSISDSSIASGNWIRVTRGTVSGSPTQVIMCIKYSQ